MAAFWEMSKRSGGRIFETDRFRLRIQPVDVTYSGLRGGKECCHERETADLLYR